MGLGDPNYRELSKMEEDPMIPQRMRDITRTQLCIPEVKAFSECSKNTGFSMVFRCQEEKNCMVECQRQWMEERPDFRAAVKEEYLNERSHYRSLQPRTYNKLQTSIDSFSQSESSNASPDSIYWETNIPDFNTFYFK